MDRIIIDKEKLQQLCNQRRAILINVERIAPFAEGTHIPVLCVVVMDIETGVEYEYVE
jgi:hypothetical protein